MEKEITIIYAVAKLNQIVRNRKGNEKKNRTILFFLYIIDYEQLS